MSGSKRCDEILRLIDEALADLPEPRRRPTPAKQPVTA